MFYENVCWLLLVAQDYQPKTARLRSTRLKRRNGQRGDLGGIFSPDKLKNGIRLRVLKVAFWHIREGKRMSALAGSRGRSWKDSGRLSLAQKWPSGHPLRLDL